jgi:PAS domain S-box-containing protein
LTGGGSVINDEAMAAGAADCFEKDQITTEGIRRSIFYAIRMWNERSRHQSLLDGLPVGLIRTDPEGLLLEVNTTAVKMLGHLDRRLLIGLQFPDLFAEPERLADAFASALAESVTVTDVEVARADGTSLWVDVRLRPIHSTGGSVGWIEWVMTEVTERRDAGRQADFRAELLDRVNSAVIVTDNDGICTFWNRHAETMYGWTAAEAVGRPITELTVTEADQSLAVEIMEQIATVGRWEGEFTVRRKDGSRFLAQVSNALLTNENGVAAGVVGVSLDVTATRAIEAELKRNQDLIAAAFESSPIGKVIASIPDLTIVSCNPAYATLLGVPVADLIGRSIREVTHPDDLGVTNDNVVKLLSRGDSNVIEKRFVRPDGEVIFAQLHTNRLHDEHGPDNFVLGHLVDITEAKRTEDRIRFQASLLDQVQNAVIATDLTGVITYWNRRAETFLGWSASEVTGRNVTEYMIPDATPERLADPSSTLAEYGTWNGEAVLTRKDGSTFPAWSTDTLIHDAGGSPVGVVSVKVDMTDMKQAEQRARSQEALNRTLLETVHVPIAIIDREGQVVVSNPSWKQQVPMGQDHHGLLPSGLKDHDTPGLHTQLTDGIADVIEGRTDRFVIEYPCDETAAPRWFRTEVAPGESGAVVSHWDITAERIATGTLEATIKAKDAFLASVSHELRTPLTAVLGLSETFRSGSIPVEDTEEVAAMIADQAQELALIVEDLLVAGRLESDTLSIKPTTVDVAVEMNKVLQPWLHMGRTEIKVEFTSGATVVFADPLRVRQILRNLIANAFRHGKPPITISGSIQEGRGVISVTDQGDGIPRDAEPRMFEPYARFRPANGQPLSIGLGLPVARQLARMMGGDLTYQRHDGQTIFEMTLPTRPQSDANPQGM